MKLYKFVIIVISLLFFEYPVFSQNSTHDLSAEISLGKTSYNGDFGNAFFNYKQPFYSVLNIGLAKYFNDEFDASLSTSMGSMGYWEGPDSNFLVRTINLSLEGRYKLNNGYILAEDFPVRPFLSLGIGFTGFFPVQKRGDFTVNIGFPIGIGVVYPVNERIEIFGQWRYFINSGDAFDKLRTNDDNDRFMMTTLGVKYNFSLEKDSDGDGIIDKEDRCPHIKGIKRNHGCPKIKRSTKDIFKEALRGIQFEYDKAIIKPSSHAILDRIVQVMDKNDFYNLEIAGHTSSDGKAEHNLDLSRRRAEAVKIYLAQHGIAENRLISIGYGEAVPIADNSTERGKALNRRVEFTVTFE